MSETAKAPGPRVTIEVQGRSYEMPKAPYTYRESKLVKSVCGYSIAGINPETALGDTDLLVAFAILAKRRAGEQFSEDALFDLELDAIKYVVEGGDEPVPPASTPPTGGATETVAGGGESSTQTETPEISGSPV